jgi:glycosyltransferase involved in cell wall biosynthesis
MRDELVTLFGVQADRIVVMQHGLNDIVLDHGYPRAECRRRLKLPADAFVLLFFGRVRPYKGVETLLEAFRHLPSDTILVVAGAPASESYGRRIEELIRMHPCRERIRCDAHFIDNAEIATYFRAADALVMPYRHIDQSGVLFLTLRFALPAIAFDVGALREYLHQEAGILVEETSAQALAEAIERFRQERQRFSPARIQEYSQRFRWANVLGPVIRAYRTS